MAKAYASAFYKSKQWLQCRRSYIDTVGGLCERCLEAGRYKPGYIVHHVEYITPDNINNPEITLSHSNLMYVCIECHNTIHYGSHTELREELTFDEEGNLINR